MSASKIADEIQPIASFDAVPRPFTGSQIALLFLLAAAAWVPLIGLGLALVRLGQELAG